MLTLQRVYFKWADLEWLLPGRTVKDVKSAMKSREMSTIKRSLSGSDQELPRQFIEALKAERYKRKNTLSPTAGAGSSSGRPDKAFKR